MVKYYYINNIYTLSIILNFTLNNRCLMLRCKRGKALRPGSREVDWHAKQEGAEPTIVK